MVEFCIGDGIGWHHKILYANLETVETRLISNYGEFAIIVTSSIYHFHSIDSDALNSKEGHSITHTKVVKFDHLDGFPFRGAY